MLLEHRESVCATVGRSGLIALVWFSAAVLVTLPAAGQGTWEPVVGGGAATPNGFGVAANQGATAMAQFDGRLFVAAGGNTGTAFVMRSTTDGASWDVVTDDGFGDANNEGVVAMAVFNGYLYVGTTNTVTGAEIWRTANGTNWSQVGPDGLGDPNNRAVAAFEEFGGYLYAGIENEVSGGRIYRSLDGTGWPPIMFDGGFGDPAHVAIVSLAGHGTRFYAGTYRVSPLYNQPGQVWWTEDFAIWNSDVAAGFGNLFNVAVVSLMSFGGDLFAGTANFATGAEVWRWDGVIWRLASLPGFGQPQSTAALRMVDSVDGLSVGVDHLVSGAKIYRYIADLDWATETSDGFGDTGNIVIGSLETFGSDLYAGTVNQAAGCEVWRRQGPIFTDGFESGDTGAWSSTVP